MPHKDKARNKAYKHAWYLKNKDRIAPLQKAYQRSNRKRYRVAALRWYHKNKAKARASANRCWEKYKDIYYPKKLARNAIRAHVRSGKVVKPHQCQACGNENTLEAHHHKGYERPYWLDVQWLCKECHILADQK